MAEKFELEPGQDLGFYIEEIDPELLWNPIPLTPGASATTQATTTSATPLNSLGFSPLLSHTDMEPMGGMANMGMGGMGMGMDMNEQKAAFYSQHGQQELALIPSHVGGTLNQSQFAEMGNQHDSLHHHHHPQQQQLHSGMHQFASQDDDFPLAGRSLPLRKSFTLQPDSVGLLHQSSGAPFVPSFLGGNQSQQQQQFSQPQQQAFQPVHHAQQLYHHHGTGVLKKSSSFDRKDAHPSDLSSSPGKIRKRGVGFDNVSDPTGKVSVAHASSPYLSALQKSRSSGSVDRINRLARTESNLSHQGSFVSEDEDDQPHDGTFGWLDDFKKDGTRGKLVFRACVNCKKAHLACDAVRPCKRCVHLGKSDSCVDVEHKKRGRPKLPRNNDGTIVRLSREGEESEEEVETKAKAKPKKKEARPPSWTQSGQQPHKTSPSKIHETLDQSPPFKQEFSSSFNENSFSQSFSSPSPSSPATIYDIEVLSVHTIEGYYTMISPECEALYGFLPQEFSLHSIYEFVCVEDIDALSALHKSLLSQDSEPQPPLAIRFKHKFGHLLPCELAMTVYKNPETGKHQSLICSTRLIPPSSSSESFDIPNTPEFAKIQDSEFSRALNPMYSYAQGETQPAALPHATSFDRLSTSMGGMKFYSQS